MGPIIPTHILTGFLGSGKTTFLNALLKDKALANTAIIINEFGETSLDHLLVEKSDDQIIELSNGCLCCTVRGQLVETLETVIEKKPDRIIIETTGLADPIPIIQALLISPSLQGRISFGSMITVFDLVHGLATLKKHDEAKSQIITADVICLSKIDLASEAEKSQAVQSIKNLDPNAKIIDKYAFLNKPEFLAQSATQDITVEPDHHHSHNVNIHNKNICCTTLRHDKPIPKTVLDMFLDLLFSAHAPHILRLKGFVNLENKTAPLLLQGVGGILAEPTLMQSWPSKDTSTRITVFLENLEADFIQRLFAGFIGTPLVDTPDKQALTNNPLAISGGAFTKK